MPAHGVDRPADGGDGKALASRRQGRLQGPGTGRRVVDLNRLLAWGEAQPADRVELAGDADRATALVLVEARRLRGPRVGGRIVRGQRRGISEGRVALDQVERASGRGK